MLTSILSTTTIKPEKRYTCKDSAAKCFTTTSFTAEGPVMNSVKADLNDVT